MNDDSKLIKENTNLTKLQYTAQGKQWSSVLSRVLHFTNTYIFKYIKHSTKSTHWLQISTQGKAYWLQCHSTHSNLAVIATTPQVNIVNRSSPSKSTTVQTSWYWSQQSSTSVSLVETSVLESHPTMLGNGNHFAR